MERPETYSSLPVFVVGDMPIPDTEFCKESCCAFHSTLQASDPSKSPGVPFEHRWGDIVCRHSNVVRRTLTEKLIGKNWVCEDKTYSSWDSYGCSHYREVVKDIGRDLFYFPSTKVLLKTTADALLCHSDAFFKAGIIHRDISPGNILIMNDGTGKLIDWDNGRRGLSQRPGRTGTWQFISGTLLDSAGMEVHTYVDDLESFLHTSTFTLVQFSSSSLNPSDQSFFMRRFDEAVVYCPPLVIMGGEAKYDKLAGGSYVAKLDFPGRPRLRQLLKDFSRLFLPVYDTVPTDKTKAQIEALKTQEGGGMRIRDMIIEPLKQVEDLKDWTQDTRSKLYTTPSSSTSTQKAKRPRNVCSSANDLSGVENSLDGGMEDEEHRESKKVRSTS